MKYLLIVAFLATMPTLAQTAPTKSARKVRLPVAASDTTLGHKFRTKSKQWDGPVTVRMLIKK